MIKEGFKYIDLFSGIGGFHQAMDQLGGECVFSSEIDKYAIETYKKNYNFNSDVNVFQADIDNGPKIPEHDVLCAGFPCQAFSKAGKQLGFEDETKGTLFFEIERILKKHKTKYFILENVRNLTTHDHGNTWKTIHSHLVKLGYKVTKKPLILSPHQIGIPQLRERVIILGVYDPENCNDDLVITFDQKFLNKDENNIYSILEKGKVDAKYNISEYETKVLNAWDNFYKNINLKVIGFPVWAEYFTKVPDDDMPDWKKTFIKKNNQLYSENKKFINSWLKENNYLVDFTPTHRKFEWQAGSELTTLWDGLIQFRPSGIRVKKPTCFPSLVAMVQVPIIGKYKRRLTVKEAGRLQSFPDSFIPNSIDQQAYKQFGNAVNVKIIKLAAQQLFKY